MNKSSLLVSMVVSANKEGNLQHALKTASLYPSLLGDQGSRAY